MSELQLLGGASSASSPSVTVASTVTSAGTLAAGKHTPVDASGGALAMTLPTGASSGTVLSLEKTDTTNNTVTVTGNIRGVAATSLVMRLVRESMVFIADSSGSWWPQAGHKTLSSIDERYDPRYIEDVMAPQGI